MYTFPASLGYSRYQIGCIFADYDLFKTIESYIKSFILISRYRNIRYNFYSSRSTPKMLGFSSLYHLSFSLYSPFKSIKNLSRTIQGYH